MQKAKNKDIKTILALGKVVVLGLPQFLAERHKADCKEIPQLDPMLYLYLTPAAFLH